jgi:hypothetical protein
VIFYLKRHRRRKVAIAVAKRPEPFLQSSPNPQSRITLKPLATGAVSTRSGSMPHAGESSTRNMAELGALRLGNLKLQQRLEVLLGRSAEREESSLPRVHTDSGWRMGMDEVPPNYTET